MIPLALLLLLTPRFVQEGRFLPLTVAVPETSANGQIETSLICRDVRGGWDGADLWRPLQVAAARLTGPAGARCRVLMRAAGGATYMASDEVPWNRISEPIQIRPRLWRTVRAPAVDAEPHWLGASGDSARCDRSITGTRCLLVPADEPGVIVAVRSDATLFALSAPGASGGAVPEAGWQTAPWGRLVRVSAPARARVSSRIVTVESALRHGRGLLREPRASSHARIHRLGRQAFWIEGGRSLAAQIEISAPGAAASRLRLEDVKASALVALHLALAPEEVIDGDVRSRGVLMEGITVVLSKLLDMPPDKNVTEDERPMELVRETKTDAVGRFSFRGLSRDTYQLLAMHPSRGRARATVQAPFHSRLILTPRAVVRGRVLTNGVPAAAASVAILPSFETIIDAPNPMLLASEAVRTGLDGRFESVLPDEGRMALTVSHEGATARVDLGDASMLPPVVDVGDIQLDAPFEVELLADLPPTCVLQAAGPMGQPGMTLIKAASAGAHRWLLRVALAGRWFLEASCAGREVALETPVVQIDRGRLTPLVLRLRR